MRLVTLPACALSLPHEQKICSCCEQTETGSEYEQAENFIITNNFVTCCDGFGIGRKGLTVVRPAQTDAAHASSVSHGHSPSLLPLPLHPLPSPPSPNHPAAGALVAGCPFGTNLYTRRSALLCATVSWHHRIAESKQGVMKAPYPELGGAGEAVGAVGAGGAGGAGAAVQEGRRGLRSRMVAVT